MPAPAWTVARPSRRTSVRIAMQKSRLPREVEVAERAAVEPAARRLELVDDLHGPDLRARRESVPAGKVATSASSASLPVGELADHRAHDVARRGCSARPS